MVVQVTILRLRKMRTSSTLAIISFSLCCCLIAFSCTYEGPMEGRNVKEIAYCSRYAARSRRSVELVAASTKSHVASYLFTPAILISLNTNSAVVVEMKRTGKSRTVAPLSLVATKCGALRARPVSLRFRLMLSLIMANASRRGVSNTAAFSAISAPTTSHPYEPPAWTKGVLQNAPQHGRLHLANLPTPICKLEPNDSSSLLQSLAKLDISLYIKRDDMTGGVELGGNKIRKLEFLLADALAGGYNSVVTIGGEQSNHCRATAAACRMVGLEPHLILRTRRANAVHEGKDNFGIVGNILFDRMVGSAIYTCTPGEVRQRGQPLFTSFLSD